MAPGVGVINSDESFPGDLVLAIVRIIARSSGGGRVLHHPSVVSA